MKIKEVMQDWVKVGQETTITELAKILDKNLTGSALVTESGKPLGVVTERDILRKIVACGRDPNQITVRRIMSSPVITIDANEDVSTASELMDKKKIRRLVVVQNGKIVGKITTNIVSRNFRYMITRDITYYRPNYSTTQ